MKYVCNVCGYVYDEEIGDAENGIEPGTKWEELPDDFNHEQYLLIEEPLSEGGKRVLLSGCSHAGILDIVEWFRPDVLIGGFHVSKMDCGDGLAALARELGSRETDYYTCHCTGEAQYAFLRGRMPRLRYLAGGETVIL